MKVDMARLWRHEKVRFGAVGAVNTAVDFVVLFSLAIGLGVPTVLANIAATTAALIVSYTLNRRTVFRADGGARRIALFIAVTLVGLWVVQTSVIVLIEAGLHAVVSDTAWSVWILLAAKLIGTGVSLTWNYLWYSKVVFQDTQAKK